MLRIHREGKATLLLLFAGLVAVNIGVLLLMCFNAFLFCVALSLLVFAAVVSFFRNPERKISANENEVLAPCDGKVVVIEEVLETEYFNERRIQLSIFMSPANVHVNRTPVGGEVSYVKYHPGKYLVAWHPKSSTENERNTVVVKNKKTEILFRQIAGVMARRIVCYVKKGDTLKAGDEMGFIKFGSRVDVFLPVDSDLKVAIGDKTKGSITVLAVLH